jgi:biopolymer transport protein ExbB/TolQ
MFELFATTTNSFDSAKLHLSVGIVGGAAGFWVGTKVRNVAGEAGAPGMFAVIGAVLFYLLAAYVVGVVVFIAALLVLVLLIKMWPTIAKAVIAFSEKLASFYPSLATRNYLKRIEAEQRRHERELEQTRSLRTDPDTKQRVIEKLEGEHTKRVLELAERNKTGRP